ncbi:MAG: DUF4974 domain-containing protein [Rikenellaceae bacterium]
MNKSRSHIEEQDRAFYDSLPKLDTPYPRSKEDVWAAISSQIEEGKIEEQPQPKVFSLRSTLIRVASVAAIFAIILGVSAAVIYNVVSDTKEEVQPTQEQLAKNIEIKDGVFIFTSAALSDTFSEIAKEYDIEIEYRGSAQRQYSGRFRRSLDIDEALQIVCRSMQLEYKLVKDKYIITRD